VALLELQESLVPALDDLTSAYGKLKRLVSVETGVKLGAILEKGARVMDSDLVSFLREVSSACFHVRDVH